ncbi:MAG: aspartate aminotransferase family protein [Hyphomicrobiales bacterium]|nr:MAG: aspartate aminotransferase family protein [Hyphomicrobiales bacterium]
MTRSADLYREALKYLPGGVSRNTLLRPGGTPFYAAFGTGCRVTDVDGVERIDFANNMAALIHGHAHPQITAAVTEAVSRGTAFTMATETEVTYARALCERAKGFDKIRFINSGTEAVMAGLKAARAFTGRAKIAKVEGTYHGAYDYAEVSQAPKPDNWGAEAEPNAVPLARGTPPGVVDDVIILPFNDPEQALARLEPHGEEIAAVLLDPVPHRAGLTPASPAFVQALRQWTRAHGALLIFDEVITFRTEYGGVQERYDDQPDLTTMGKMIGGGFPVGALAGSEEAMSVFETGAHGLRLPHSGTFSANPVTMTAGQAAMALYDRDAVARLNRLGDTARAQIGEAIRLADIPACITGTGSMFRIHFKPRPPKNYRESFETAPELAAAQGFIEHMYGAGIMMIHTCTGMLSTPMGEAEISQMAETALGGFRKVRSLLPEPVRD